MIGWAGRTLAALTVVFAGAISSPASASKYGAEYDSAFTAMLGAPSDLDITFRYAKIALSVGDYEGAIGALERMLIYNPDLPRIHLELARLYARLDSREVARRYYNSALRYDPPADISNQIESELAALQTADNPSRFSATFFAGLRYQSNANAGPTSSRIRLGGGNATLADRFLKEDDVSLVMAGTITHRYDFGRDPSVVMLTRANSYLSRQFDLDQLDTFVAGLSTGPEFAINNDTPIGWFRPYLKGQVITLDDTVYYGLIGGGMEFGGVFDAATSDSWSLDLGVLYKDFNASAAFPALNNRDGINVYGNGQIGFNLDGKTRLSFFSQAQYQDANENFEAYVDAGLTARVVRSFDSPVAEWETGPWYGSASAEVNVRRYDDPDPVVDPGKRRRDLDLILSLGLAVPLTEGLTAVVEGRQQWRSSSIRNFEFNDTSVLTGLSYRF